MAWLLRAFENLPVAGKKFRDAENGAARYNFAGAYCVKIIGNPIFLKKLILSL
jgi:hypothetical protein